MPAQPTVTVLSFQHLFEVAQREFGDEPRNLATLCGLGWPLSDKLEVRLPWSALTRLWEVLVERTGDRSLPVRAALAAAERERGLLAMLCTSFPTLRHGLKALERYWPTVTSAVRVRIEGPDTVVLEPIVPLSTPGCRYALEFDVVDITIGAVRAVVGDVAPLSVEFGHGPPDDVAPFEGALGCPVRFGSTRWAITFSADVMDQPLLTARAGVVRYLIPEAERLLALSGQSASVAEQVRAVIPDLLRDERPSADEAARRLAIGRRTLERQLRREGTSFRRLLDACRYNLARQWLDQQVSLGDIAERLGYSDVRAFSRAFSRWSGGPPTHYRRSSSSQPELDD